MTHSSGSRQRNLVFETLKEPLSFTAYRRASSYDLDRYSHNNSITAGNNMLCKFYWHKFLRISSYDLLPGFIIVKPINICPLRLGIYLYDVRPWPSNNRTNWPHGIKVHLVDESCIKFPQGSQRGTEKFKRFVLWYYKTLFLNFHDNLQHRKLKMITKSTTGKCTIIVISCSARVLNTFHARYSRNFKVVIVNRISTMIKINTAPDVCLYICGFLSELRMEKIHSPSTNGRTDESMDICIPYQLLRALVLVHFSVIAEPMKIF